MTEQKQPDTPIPPPTPDPTDQKRAPTLDPIDQKRFERLTTKSKHRLISWRWAEVVMALAVALAGFTLSSEIDLDAIQKFWLGFAVVGFTAINTTLSPHNRAESRRARRQAYWRLASLIETRQVLGFRAAMLESDIKENPQDALVELAKYSPVPPGGQ